MLGVVVVPRNSVVVEKGEQPIAVLVEPLLQTHFIQPVLVPAASAMIRLSHVLNNSSFDAVPTENQILHGSRKQTSLLAPLLFTFWAGSWRLRTISFCAFRVCRHLVKCRVARLFQSLTGRKRDPAGSPSEQPSPWGTFTSYSLPASWRTPLWVIHVGSALSGFGALRT